MAKSMQSQLKLIAKIQCEETENFVKAAVIQAMNVAAVKSPVGNPDLWVWYHPGRQMYVDYVAWKGVPKGYTGGQYRANWRLTLNGIDPTVKETTNYTSEESNQVNDLVSFKLGDDIYFTNPSPYARRIEYDAWSTQATGGVARPAVLALKKALNSGVTQLK